LLTTAHYQKGVVSTATEEFLSPEEVGDRLGVSVHTVRRWIKTGNLRAFKPGKEYRVRRADLEEFLLAREVRPKAPRRSPSELSLFNGLEEERREAVYGPWLDFVERYVERWESRIDTGNFDLGSINEFVALLEDLSPTLSELEAAERQEVPRDSWGDYHENLRMNLAIARLMGILNPLLAAAAAKFEDSDLEQLRRRRAEQEAEFPNIVGRAS
jgi:excisionase family DNA binding protein